ncbi:MAG: phage/plasmid primase, P4 family, partial [Bacteroidia bacterium]|nr:phage/plasmid primase, P4 family [Bacteroidia bacterium]
MAKQRTATAAVRAFEDARPYMRLLGEREHFDTAEGLLCAQNGVVDLRTGQLLPHSPEYLFTHITNAEYHPNAQAPLWEKFLSDIFCGSAPLIAWVQKLIGAAVTGAQREHVLPILWGSGANGKTTFLETLKVVLGGFAGSVPLEVLTGAAGVASERLNVQLYGKRLVFAAETREDQTLNENRVKAITGGD